MCFFFSFLENKRGPADEPYRVDNFTVGWAKKNCLRTKAKYLYIFVLFLIENFPFAIIWK